MSVFIRTISKNSYRMIKTNIFNRPSLLGCCYVFEPATLMWINAPPSTAPALRLWEALRGTSQHTQQPEYMTTVFFFLGDMLLFSIETCLQLEGSSNFSVCVRYGRAGWVWEVSHKADQVVLRWAATRILKHP